jgi:hypothetical protein
MWWTLWSGFSRRSKFCPQSELLFIAGPLAEVTHTPDAFSLWRTSMRGQNRSLPGRGDSRQSARSRRVLRPIE